MHRMLAVLTCLLVVAGCGGASPASTEPPELTVGPATSSAIAAGPSAPSPTQAVPLFTPPASLPPGAAIVARLRVVDPDGPGWLTTGFGSIWVGNASAVVRISDTTGAKQGSVSTHPVDDSLASTGFGSVWESNYGQGVVYRIDPQGMRVTATIPVGTHPEGVAVTGSAVWVSLHNDGTVVRIDPATDRVVATVQVSASGRNGPYRLAATATDLWVQVANIYSVLGIDADSNAIIAKVPLDAYPASDGTELWVAAWDGKSASSVLRIDPITGQVLSRTLLDDQAPNAIAVGLGSVWVWTPGGLYRVDQASAQVVGRLTVCDGSCDGGWMTAQGGSIWLTISGEPTLLRIEPQ